MSISEQHESESEDSYFVSMTDIMVGMLFVFIILLMYFVFRIQNTSEPTVPLSEYQAIKRDLDAAASRIKSLEDEVKRLSQNPLEKYLREADATRGKILTELKNSMRGIKGIEDSDVRVIPEQGILRLAGDMLFPKGISKIATGSPSENAVKALATALSKVLPCFSLGPASNPTRLCNPNAVFIDAVFIEGHTDNTPIIGVLEGGVTDNLSLSARRAINTVQVIYNSRPPLSGMFSISPSQEGRPLGEGSSPLINPAAFGDTRPANSNDTEEGKKGNRRIDVRLLMYSPRSESLDAIRKLVNR